MVLYCGCDPDFYVELKDPLVVSPGTEFCCECERLIPCGEEHYHVRTWSYNDDTGEKTERGQHRACEECGDLALSVLELGYCWFFGELRADIREMS